MNHENPLTIFRDCSLCSLMLLGSPFHRNSAYLCPQSGHGNFVCSIEKMLIIFWIEFNILFGDCSSFLRKFRFNLQRWCFHAWWYWYWFWYWYWVYEYQFTIIEMTEKWANKRTSLNISIRISIPTSISMSISLVFYQKCNANREIECYLNPIPHFASFHFCFSVSHKTSLLSIPFSIPFHSQNTNGILNKMANRAV